MSQQESQPDEAIEQDGNRADQSKVLCRLQVSVSRKGPSEHEVNRKRHQAQRKQYVSGEKMREHGLSPVGGCGLAASAAFSARSWAMSAGNNRRRASSARPTSSA